MAIFSKLANKYASRVNFIGATVDSTKEDVLALKNRFSLNYPLGFVDPQVVRSWHAEVLPTTYILDTLGNALWAKNGELTEEALESSLLEALSR